MSLFNATFRTALRRRWKGLLFVLICGAALVAVSVAFDVDGIASEMAEIAEAMSEDQSEQPSAEQAEAFGRGAGTVFFHGAMTLLFHLGALIVGFTMPGGLVAEERRTGAIMLWAQHPTSLSSFYARRYLGIQAANFTAQSLFGLMAVFATSSPAGGAGTPLGEYMELCTRGVLACAITFALSAHGIRRATFAALAYYIVSNVAAQIANAASTVDSRFTELLTALVPYFAFPGTAMTQMVEGFQSSVDWDWGATGIVLYHFAAWSVIAWLGLRRIERRPLKL